MTIIIITILVTILLFGGVLFFGAPYLPSLSRPTRAALELLDLKPGQTLLELGCGDGKVVLAAAGKGLKVVGIELNPILAAIAWLRTRRYRGQVKIIWGNFWQVAWPPADGIFVFLLDKYMAKLDRQIVAAGWPVRLVSFTFQIPGRKAVTARDGVFLYVYDDKNLPKTGV